jgi:hypothetical protein
LAASNEYDLNIAVKLEVKGSAVRLLEDMGESVVGSRKE